MVDVLRLPRSKWPNIVHLCVNTWQDMGEREPEILACLAANEAVFDVVDVWDEAPPRLGAMGPIRPYMSAMMRRKCTSNRALFEPDAGYVHVLANADIEFPRETIELLRLVDLGDHAFALSRYNPRPDGSLDLQWQPRGSQDCWIFQGRPKPVEADFTMGVLGCDNRFAHELERAGYTVVNPCLTLKTIHRHAGSETVWSDDEDKNQRLRERAKSGLPRVPRPYKLVEPCELEVM